MDQKAFAQNLMACQDRLYAYAAALVGNMTAVDDIVQQTNLILWRKADQFEPGTEFGAWACRVAFYEILKHRQRLKREKLLFDDDLLSIMAERCEQFSDEATQRRSALRLCLKKLSPDQRELLERRYEPGASVADMAGELHRSAGSLSQELYRIRQALTDCIRKRLSQEQAG